MSEQPAPGERAGEKAAPGERASETSAPGEQHGAGRPDPMRGLRGVYAAVLVLESIVVLLGLLVVSKFASDAIAPLGLGLVLALAAAMVVGAGLQRRSWGLGYALALQVLLIACAVFSPPLGLMGLVFAGVWVALLVMRREVARRMAAGR